MPNATAMQFLHHPLFAVMQDQGVLACRSRLPDAELYTLVPSFKTPLSSLDPRTQRSLVQESGFNLLRWLVRRGVSVHESNCVLLDTEALRLHPVDLVAERAGCLTLIFVYFSKQRDAALLAKMLEAGKTMKRLVARQYVLEADVVVVNLYGGGLVQGAWVEDP